MSYIGNNPTVEDLRVTGTLGIRSAKLLDLTVSSTAPGSPAEGMIYYNDGTGTISEGLKVYKNGNFVSLDAQQGDADTLQLLQAKDQPTIKFNAAISSTSVVGNTLPVPTPTSTGTGGVGTFEVPSTGTDALMSNDDASRVFKYISSSTADSESDYFGVSLAIPKGFRSENIALQFLYRTVTTSTTAMSDGQFKVFIQDKTNGKSVTSTTTGSIAPGSNIQVSDRTGIGVGDKVFLESGTGNAAAPANDITEAYVTSIDGSTGAGNITVSQTVQMPATAGGRIITKLLSDLTVGGIDAAPSTAGTGKIKKVQFIPDSTCAEVYVWFQNTASTGSTKVDTLFFDQFLISGNKFLQVESQTKNEVVQVYPSAAASSTQWSTTNTAIIQFPSTGDIYNTTGNLVTFASTAAAGCSITANKECIVSGFLMMQPSGTGEIFGWSLNSTQLTTYIQSITAAHIVSSIRSDASERATCPVTIRLQPGDVLRPHAGNVPSSFTSTGAVGRISLDIKPVDQEKVIVESEEEIFTDWTEWSWAPEGFGTVSGSKAFYRRVGDSLEISGYFISGTPSSTVDAAIPLPGNYAIDTGRVGASNTWQVGQYSKLHGTNYYSADGGLGWVFYNSSSATKLYLSDQTTGDGAIGIEKGNAVASASQGVLVKAKLPIVGWTSKYTPLLSMPLADYSEFQNTYSARVTNTGTTSAITSQSGNFIASSTRTGSNGAINIVWTSGFFTVAPSVVVSVDGQTGNSFAMVSAISSTGCTINADEDGGSNPDRNMNLTVTRQGADYREVPQATAAIIKPSVCLVKDVKASNDNGGATGTQNTWHDRTLNRLEGESWFVNSFSSNVVTLPAGQYEIEAVQMASQCDGWATRLYNTTDSKTLAPGSPNKASAGAYYANSHVKWVGTFAKATGVKLQYIVESTAGGADSLGLNAATSGTNSTEDSIYAQMKITKLK
jgi:hypothetical protein